MLGVIGIVLVLLLVSTVFNSGGTETETGETPPTQTSP